MGMGTAGGSRPFGATTVQLVETPSPLALRPRDAAKVLGISQRLLWDLTAPRGPIPVVRVGSGKRRACLYEVDALKVWLKQNAEAAGGER
jgi:hypothetical protein